MAVPIEKIPSGINNLDPLLGGGFPKGSLIVFYGPPGVGKTICSLFYLWEGLKNNEKSLYVTFEEGEKSILKLATNIGIDLEPYRQNKTFFLRDFTALVSERDVDKSIIEKIKEAGIRRVVVDSLTTAVIDNVGAESSIAIKKFIRNLFRALHRSDATCIVISRDELEFETAVGLADCAIYFQPHPFGDQGLSSCNITKVRLSKHNRSIHYLDITRPGEISIRIQK